MLSINSCSIFSISLRTSGQPEDTHLLVYLPLLLLASQMSRMAGSIDFKLFRFLGACKQIIIKLFSSSVLLLAHLVAAGRWLLGLMPLPSPWRHAQQARHAYAAPERRELPRIDTAVDATKTVDSLGALVKPKATAARVATKALLYKYTKEPKLEP